MNDTIPGEIREIKRRLEAVELEIVTNTELTRDIKDVLEAAKMGLKVIGGIGTVFKWVGGIAAAATAIYTFIYVLTHGGIGPK